MLKAEIRQLPYHIHALHSRRRFPSQKADGNKYEGERQLLLRPKFHYDRDPHTLRLRKNYNSQPPDVKLTASRCPQKKCGKQLHIRFPPFIHPEASG